MTKYKTSQLISLVIGRLLIGWHFFYEGYIKITTPDWSAKSFLLESKGIFCDFFIWMTESEKILSVVNFMNAWGLLLIGISLMIGCLTRISTLGGIILMLLFYLSHPPLIGVEYIMPSEGSYLFVNKNLIELVMLCILFLFPTSKIIGIDRLLFKAK